ncbi:hypothetical protein ACFVVX_27435 [Kitasatospora sp. NPDC058170]|uniref:hypothetical protein n=1 Tax=Kitasatospora sp. NPDC058170 TaxID=3346364 RepID=UPI0036DB0167
MTNESEVQSRGLAPEEFELPVEVVERIRHACALLGIEVAPTHAGPGLVLWREPWKPGTVAEVVQFSWYASGQLLDACEANRDTGPAEELYDVTGHLEETVADVLRLTGLDVRRDPYTREWGVHGIIGPPPA